MRYLLQRASDLSLFDVVDDFTFANRHKAMIQTLKGDGSAEFVPRYTDAYVSIDDDDGTVEISGSFDLQNLAVINRFVGVKENQSAHNRIHEPTAIEFRLRKGGPLSLRHEGRLYRQHGVTA